MKDIDITKLTDDPDVLAFCGEHRLGTIGEAWEYLQFASGFPGLGRDRLAAAFERFWLANPSFNVGSIEMAKKRAGTSAKQKQFEADGFPDPLPKEVVKAMEAYLTAKREAAEASEESGSRKVLLIEVARKHNIERIPIDGENKFIEIGKADTVKVKTVPKDQREMAGVD